MNGVTDYILKPTLNPDNLLEVLRKTAQKIPGMHLQEREGFFLEKALERFLLGFDQVTVEQAKENEMQLKQQFQGSCFYLAGWSMKLQNGQFTYDKIKKFVETRSYGKHVLVFLNESIVLIISNFDYKEEAVYLQEIKEIATELKAVSERNFCVASPCLSSLDQVRECLNEQLMVQVGRSFYMGNQAILFLEQLQLEERKKAKNGYPKFDFSTFSALLSDENYKQAYELLEQYIKEAIEHKFDEQRLKNQTKNMLYMLLDDLENKKMDTLSLRAKCFKLIDQAAYVEEFLQHMNEMKKELDQFLQEYSGNEDKVMKQILEYISKNYQENLDLAEAAKEFNFNYYYLSGYFNQHVAEGFSGYLNKLRIQKACELLRETDLTIAQISQEVGYSDQSYFCRVFKKMTLNSPSSWRKNR